MSGPWEVYELVEQDYVVPLENLPAVWTNVEDDIHDWARPSIDWFNTPEDWDVLRASDGPDDWPRVAADPDAPLGESQGDAERVAAPHPDLEITDYESDNSSISFEVSEVGSPVLVRTSYFANWETDGAEGPYRVTPNFMVVIPTENSVELTYGRTPMEYGSWALTAVGLVLLVGLARRPDAIAVPDGETPYEFFGDRQPITLEEFWDYQSERERTGEDTPPSTSEDLGEIGDPDADTGDGPPGGSAAARPASADRPAPPHDESTTPDG